jgi:hypothetical protein
MGRGNPHLEYSMAGSSANSIMYDTLHASGPTQLADNGPSICRPAHDARCGVVERKITTILVKFFYRRHAVLRRAFWYACEKVHRLIPEQVQLARFRRRTGAEIAADGAGRIFGVYVYGLLAAINVRV